VTEAVKIKMDLVQGYLRCKNKMEGREEVRRQECMGDIFTE